MVEIKKQLLQLALQVRPELQELIAARKEACITCNRRVGRVREIFNLAMEEDLIDRNPFKKKTIPVTVRAAKKQEPSEATVLKIVEHCPTTEWKLLFVFARWIG